nr:immunoglobulin heavy chain junction region [Macaca mulatta]MOV89689.1 immunoglobulin heavy chain junction region [Macaca mulatta]
CARDYLGHGLMASQLDYW